jgi:hypothetical protein
VAVKSVLDIDINDEKFKRFSALFDKYQSALGKLPGMWKDVDKETAGAAATFANITAAMMAQSHVQNEANEAARNSGKELQHHSSLWNRIQKSTTGVLGNVAGIAKWLARMGVGLGLGGLGVGAGLFGLRALAEHVSDSRNQALSTGMGIGEAKAFGINQGRYFGNDDQLLRSAFMAQSVGTSQNVLAKILGVNTEGGPLKVADRMLVAVQELAKRTPANLVGQLPNMYPQLGEFGFDLNNIETLRNLSRSELRGQIRQGESTAKGIGLSDRQGQAYQNFVSGVDTTFSRIAAQIQRDLVPLLGPIERLMKVIGKDITSFLASPAAAAGINNLTGAIDRFVKYLSSPDFAKALDHIDHLVHPLDSAGSDIADRFEDADTVLTARYGIPAGTASLQASQSRVYLSSKDLVAKDEALLQGLKGVRPADRLKAMLTEFFMQQQDPRFDTAAFARGVRGNPNWFGQVPVSVQGQVNASTPRIQVKVSKATGADVNVSVNGLRGGAS